MNDFFISHSSIDKIDKVDGLVSTLKNMGYSVWYDKDDILLGDIISEEIKQGLRQSYCLLLVLTENFMKSKWTYFEAGQFTAMDSRRIIPLLYELSSEHKKQITDILGNKKYIEMAQTSREQMASELIRALERTKRENRELVVMDHLRALQKELASYETLNSDLISIQLKDYLDFWDRHIDFDFMLLSAKKLVSAIIIDLLKMSDGSLAADLQAMGSNYIWLYQKAVQKGIGSVNLQEYLEFLLVKSSSVSSVNELEVLNHALENILTYYIQSKYPIKPSFASIEIVMPDNLVYKDFAEMYDIDRKVMRDDLIADIDTCYAWYQYNNYTHIAVRDIRKHKVVGYFSVLPITEETYKHILSGDFKDNEFTQDSIVQYIFPDFYKLYVAGVGIDPEYQNTGAFIKLYNALIDMLLTLAKERDIYISEILAEASTRQGEKFCKMIQMRKICHSSSETDIYGLTLIPPEFRLNNRKGKELFDLCQRKFEEYRDYFESAGKYETADQI